MADVDHDIDTQLTEFFAAREVPAMMITQVVVVAAYLDGDGVERWTAHTAGRGSTSQAVGLCEYAKHWLVQTMLAENDEDD